MDHELSDRDDDREGRDGRDRDEDRVIIPPVPIAGVMVPAAGAAVALGLDATDGGGDESEEARGARIEQDEPRADEG